jgi:spore coat-associated protein N
MSRLSVLAAHPRRTLSTLALVLAAVGIAVGSGANFTASKANASNTFASGSLSIGNSPTGAILTVPAMKPGDTADGYVDIENTGTLSGAFSLTSSSETGDAALLGALDLVVKDCGMFASGTPTCDAGDTTVFTGKVGAMDAGASALGTFAAADKHKYWFKVTLPSGSANALQGLSAGVQFDWSATSL